MKVSYCKDMLVPFTNSDLNDDVHDNDMRQLKQKKLTNIYFFRLNNQWKKNFQKTSGFQFMALLGLVGEFRSILIVSLRRNFDWRKQRLQPLVNFLTPSLMLLKIVFKAAFWPIGVHPH